MSWTTPKTISAGDLGTALDWDIDIRDNTNYLYSQEQPSFTYFTPTRVIDTVYQNTSGKVLFVMVSVNSGSLSAIGTQSIYFYCAAGADPTGTTVAYSSVDVPSGTRNVTHSTCIIVPLNYYYKVHRAGGTGESITQWVEWTIG